MNRTFLLLLIACCFASGLAGCSQNVTAPRNTELGDIDESGSQVTAVSQEQAEAFGKQLEDALTSGNAGAATSLVLSDRILDRVVSGLNLSGKLETGFRSGMASNNPVAATMTQLVTAVQSGGSYSLVRTAVRGGEMHAIFRLIDGDSSLNYHDFRLIPDGEAAKADQIFVAATGESFADTIINAVGPAVRAQQSTMGRVTGDAAQKMKDLEQQSKMMLAARANNSAEALRIYETLPDEQKKSKAVQLARVMASQEKPDDEYVRVISDYTSRFPNDPSVALISFDRAVLKKDLPGVRKCIGMLDKWTGGDDYLKLLTASVVCDWGELDYAKELYDAADPRKVGTSDAHNYKLFASLQCKDFGVSLEQMRVMRDDYDFEFDVEANPVFAEFRQSQECQAWLADSK